jgi:hypothetical protein
MLNINSVLITEGPYSPPDFSIVIRALSNVGKNIYLKMPVAEVMVAGIIYAIVCVARSSVRDVIQKSNQAVCQRRQVTRSNGCMSLQLFGQDDDSTEI